MFNLCTLYLRMRLDYNNVRRSVNHLDSIDNCDGAYARLIFWYRLYSQYADEDNVVSNVCICLIDIRACHLLGMGYKFHIVLYCRIFVCGLYYGHRWINRSVSEWFGNQSVTDPRI